MSINFLDKKQCKIFILLTVLLSYATLDAEAFDTTNSAEDFDINKSTVNNNSLNYFDLTRANISFNFGENTEPNIFIPIYWNSVFFSGLGYSSSYKSEQESLTQISGKISSTTYENIASINVLSYQYHKSDVTYTIGATGSYRDIKLDEFGYYSNDNDMVAFSNHSDINVIDATITADITISRIFDIFNMRVGAGITPYSLLENRQSLSLASSQQTDVAEGKYQQELAYNLYFQAQLELPWSIDIGLNSWYDYTPLKFKSVQFNPQTLLRDVQTVKTQEIEYGLSVKLLFPKINIMGIEPYVGFSQKYYTLKKDGKNLEDNIETSYFTTGLEKMF